MERALLVALGGGIGAAARYLVSLVAARWLGTELPYGTLKVATNVVGTTALCLTVCVLGIAAGRFVLGLRG